MRPANEDGIGWPMTDLSIKLVRFGVSVERGNGLVNLTGRGSIVNAEVHLTSPVFDRRDCRTLC